MPRPFLLFAPACLLVALVAGTALQAAERYNALFADGSRIVGEEVRDWYDTKAEPKLADRKLLDEKNHVRWVLDTSLAPSLPGECYVEHVGGDRLPCRVLHYDGGADNPYERQLPHLVVEPTISTQWPDPRQRKPARILTRWLRRVVWEARGPDRYQPGTLFHRDGRQLSFRALRWQSESVRLLLDDGPSEVPFAHIAELHLPQQDAWEAYCEQLATISPDCTTRLMRIEGEEGLRITASMQRMQARNNGSHPDHWYHGLQPAWSLDMLWLRHRSIRARMFFQPHELPLSAWEPAEVSQRHVLGGGWTWQRDRNVQGGPLRSAGENHGWGLGTHAQCSLTFELPPLARRFRGRVALDELAGSGGCARARIYLDSQETSPVFSSDTLIGSHDVVEIAAIDLPLPSKPAPAASGERAGRPRVTMTLVSDAVYEDRPKGADPFDIRDLVDWLEPVVELEASLLAEEVARRAVDLVPAWHEWEVAEAGSGPALLANLWDESDRQNLRYVPLVGIRQKLLMLSRNAEVSEDAKALLLCVGRLANQTTPARLLVEANGKTLGSFEVPERRGTSDPDPIFIPLDEHVGKEIALRVTQSPLGPQSLIEWRSAVLVARWPGLETLFEDEADPLLDLTRPDASLDDQDRYSGQKCLRLLPHEGEEPKSPPIAFPIRESPRLGEFRYLRFAWKLQGEGRICCSIGHDGLWGADAEVRKAPHPRSFRYDAGSGEPSYDAAMRIDKRAPDEWVVVTRDLYADFGEFTLTGLSFSVPVGDAGWIDHVYLGRGTQDFTRIEARPVK